MCFTLGHVYNMSTASPLLGQLALTPGLATPHFLSAPGLEAARLRLRDEFLELPVLDHLGQPPVLHVDLDPGVVLACRSEFDRLDDLVHEPPLAAREDHVVQMLDQPPAILE